MGTSLWTESSKQYQIPVWRVICCMLCYVKVGGWFWASQQRDVGRSTSLLRQPCQRVLTRQTIHGRLGKTRQHQNTLQQRWRFFKQLLPLAKFPTPSSPNSITPTFTETPKLPCRESHGHKSRKSRTQTISTCRDVCDKVRDKLRTCRGYKSWRSRDAKLLWKLSGQYACFNWGWLKPRLPTTWALQLYSHWFEAWLHLQLLRNGCTCIAPLWKLLTVLIHLVSCCAIDL